MVVKEEPSPSRTGLSSAQRALLEERLQRARQTAGAKTAEPRTSIPRRAATAELPLSFAQERLWFLDQLSPGVPVNNVCQAVRMQGKLDLIALEKALNEIVRRHEILRTNFVAVEGRPLQAIGTHCALPLTVVDLSSLSRDEQQRECDRCLQDEARRSFDLSRDLLLRVLLIRRGATEHMLMLTMHHIISDGWSLGIFFRELAAIYRGFVAGEPAELPELPVQFADYALWEREQLREATVDKLLGYWKKQLSGTLPVLDLPIDRPRTATATFRGASQVVQLSRPLTQALKTLSQHEGVTLFMTLLAAFQVLLHRCTGQHDILVGSALAGRRKLELENLIGFFVNTLVFRGDLSGDPTFKELLGRTRETTLAAFAHQDLPFERLVQELGPDRAVRQNPLFQVMFVLQNAVMSPVALPDLNLEPLDVDNGTAKFDLTLQMLESPQGLRAALEYNVDLFESATIARLLKCFETLLENLTAHPEERISRLGWLTSEARAQVVVEFNRTETKYPADRTIADLFDEQVRRAPHAPAVTFEGRTLTYAELDGRAEQLAQTLRGMGVGTDTRVGLCLERSLELIVALVAIVKAGGAYVSLDLAYPPERLAFMIEDTKTPVLITQRKLRGKLPRNSATVLCLDESGRAKLSHDAGKPVDRAPGAAITPESLAYVSYTSGSTGKPKGVEVPHRGVVRLVKETNFARFGADEVFFQFAPVAFDASTLEIWGALLNGGRLVVFRPGPASLSELGEAIEREGVTTLWLTAGLFHQMVEEQIDRLRNVRQLLAGGDVLSPAHVARALACLPGTRLINGYGPTENTTFTCCHEITAAPAAGRTVPIGKPIANTQVYILDPQRQPVPIGVAGELYTGGAGLARGYLNRPELTAEKFVPNPFVGEASSAAATPRLYRTGDLARWLPDGTVEFLGRIDRQAKIRGFRVEPAEVESVLAAHPAVKECAVVVRDDPSGGKCLVAYVVSKPGTASKPEPWRSFLEQKLPAHLVPSKFVALAALPLNANGKLDVAALPMPDGTRPDLQRKYVAPRDPIETQLVEIWSHVLGVQQVGVQDRFFDLGGHSLLAVRMTAQLEKKFGKKLPVAAIFQHRTIEELARLLRSNDTRYAPSTSLVEIQGHGSRPPLYLVHGVGGGMFWGYSNLARHLGADQPLYAFKSRGLDGLSEWESIEEMAAHYVQDLRIHQPEGPYQLGGYCFGGVVAYEMAQQLVAQGERVTMLALMNCSPPNTSYERVDNRSSPRWLLRFFANIAYWLGCFVFRWTMRERAEFVRWKFRLLRKKTRSAQSSSGLNLTDVDEMVNLAAYSEAQRKLWQTHVRALKTYEPKPFAGRITLFRTRGHALLCSFDPLYGWGELAQGGVAVRVMPGGHGSILDEPHVRTVARALDQSLHEASPGKPQEALA